MSPKVKHEVKFSWTWISYFCLIVGLTHSLTRPLFGIQWVILTLTFQGHSKLNLMVQLGIPYMITYNNSKAEQICFKKYKPSKP